MNNIKKVFHRGYLGTQNYRIPSLLTTVKGTMIAAIDRGHGPDCGNITIAIRRSLDGGRTWLPAQQITDLPGGANTAEDYWALNIDPALVQDRETGRIFMIVNMYPESKANMERDIIECSNGYKEIDGKQYFVLRDHTGPASALTYTKEYTVREGGVVYDDEGNPTEYTLPSITEGTLYKNGEPCGTVMLYTGEKAAPLTMVLTGHTWLIYSDDEGESWAEPIDLNDQVKPADERGIGPGPGVGIQLESGRLIFPFWSTNKVSCGVLYSDDHGKSWTRSSVMRDFGYEGLLSEAQAVEVTDKNGNRKMKLFCRNLPYIMIAESTDGGKSWGNFYYDEALINPDCQITVINYPYPVKGLEGKQVVLYAGPNSTWKRYLGTVHIGYYDPETDRFVWVGSRVVSECSFLYSCLSVIGEGKVGLLYEIGTTDISFKEIKIDEFELEI